MAYPQIENNLNVILRESQKGPVLNDNLPAAPNGNVNVTWQVDQFQNISAYVPSGGGGSTNSKLRVVTLGYNNGSTVVPAGAVNAYTAVPYAGTIVGYTLIGSPSGSVQLDVRKINSGIPTGSNSIVGTAPPTLTNSQYVYSTTLTGWNTAVAAEDVFGFSITSATSITNFVLQLFVQVN